MKRLLSLVFLACLLPLQSHADQTFKFAWNRWVEGIEDTQTRYRIIIIWSPDVTVPQSQWQTVFFTDDLETVTATVVVPDSPQGFFDIGYEVLGPANPLPSSPLNEKFDNKPIECIVQHE